MSQRFDDLAQQDGVFQKKSKKQKGWNVPLPPAPVHVLESYVPLIYLFSKQLHCPVRLLILTLQFHIAKFLSDVPASWQHYQLNNYNMYQEYNYINKYNNIQAVGLGEFSHPRYAFVCSNL